MGHHAPLVERDPYRGTLVKSRIKPRFSPVGGRERPHHVPGYVRCPPVEAVVFAWGVSEDGQLGLSSSEDVHSPKVVESLLGYRFAGRGRGRDPLVAGSRGSMAVTSDGGALTWGWDARCTLARGVFDAATNTVGGKPVPERDEDRWGGKAHRAAYPDDPYALPPSRPRFDPFPRPALGLDGVRVVQVALGGWHAVARDDRGRVFAWGGNEYCQCGLDTGGRDVAVATRVLPRIRALRVAAGGMHSVLTTSHHHVWAFGEPWGDTGGGDRTEHAPLVPPGAASAYAARRAGALAPPGASADPGSASGSNAASSAAGPPASAAFAAAAAPASAAFAAAAAPASAAFAAAAAPASAAFAAAAAPPPPSFSSHGGAASAPAPPASLLPPLDAAREARRPAPVRFELPPWAELGPSDVLVFDDGSECTVRDYYCEGGDDAAERSLGDPEADADGLAEGGSAGGATAPPSPRHSVGGFSVASASTYQSAAPHADRAHAPDGAAADGPAPWAGVSAGQLAALHAAGVAGEQALLQQQRAAAAAWPASVATSPRGGALASAAASPRFAGAFAPPPSPPAYATPPAPLVVAVRPRVVEAVCGAFHTLALDAEGRVWAWGLNEYGQLGVGDTASRREPVLVGGLLAGEAAPPVAALAAGGWHSLAIDANGDMHAWGRGEHGRLGVGGSSSASRLEPTPVLPPSDGAKWATVSAGGTHSVALDDRGRCWAWGRSSFGRLGRGKGAGHRSAHAPVEVPLPGEAARWAGVAVAAGGRHTLLLAVPRGRTQAHEGGGRAAPGADADGPYGTANPTHAAAPGFPPHAAAAAAAAAPPPSVFASAPASPAPAPVATPRASPAALAAAAPASAPMPPTAPAAAAPASAPASAPAPVQAASPPASPGEAPEGSAHGGSAPARRGGLGGKSVPSSPTGAMRRVHFPTETQAEAGAAGDGAQAEAAAGERAPAAEDAAAGGSTLGALLSGAPSGASAASVTGGGPGKRGAGAAPAAASPAASAAGSSAFPAEAAEAGAAPSSPAVSLAVSAPPSASASASSGALSASLAPAVSAEPPAPAGEAGGAPDEAEAAAEAAAGARTFSSDRWGAEEAARPPPQAGSSAASLASRPDPYDVALADRGLPPGAEPFALDASVPPSEGGLESGSESGSRSPSPDLGALLSLAVSGPPHHPAGEAPRSPAPGEEGSHGDGSAGAPHLGGGGLSIRGASYAHAWTSAAASPVGSVGAGGGGGVWPQGGGSLSRAGSVGAGLSSAGAAGTGHAQPGAPQQPSMRRVGSVGSSLGGSGGGHAPPPAARSQPPSQTSTPTLPSRAALAAVSSQGRLDALLRAPVALPQDLSLPSAPARAQAASPTRGADGAAHAPARGAEGAAPAASPPTSAFAAPPRPPSAAGSRAAAAAAVPSSSSSRGARESHLPQGSFGSIDAFEEMADGVDDGRDGELDREGAEIRAAYERRLAQAAEERAGAPAGAPGASGAGPLVGALGGPAASSGGASLLSPLAPPPPVRASREAEDASRSGSDSETSDSEAARRLVGDVDLGADGWDDEAMGGTDGGEDREGVWHAAGTRVAHGLGGSVGGGSSDEDREEDNE